MKCFRFYHLLTQENNWTAKFKKNFYFRNNGSFDTECLWIRLYFDLNIGSVYKRISISTGYDNIVKYLKLNYIFCL